MWLNGKMVNEHLILRLILHILVIGLCSVVSGQTVKVLQLSRISKFFSSLPLNDHLETREQHKNWRDWKEFTRIEEKVSFQLFNRLIPHGSFLNHSKQLKSTKILDDVPTKFVTHGWLSTGKNEVCQSIKDQYLSNKKSNVFIVHWDRIAISYLYLFVIKKMKYVADYYAEFLEELITNKGVAPEKIHLIGHSLGAHLSGMVGKRLRAKNITIGRITGLDPALPGYQEYFGLEKLSSTDASFVDVIHTCGCTLGIMDPIGHVDFYPNGGTYPMPGCENVWSQKQCSHSRSWQYFAESIIHPFLAVKCKSFESFRKGECLNDTIEMGNNISTNARGSFYFSTSEIFPYSLGKNGTAYIPRITQNKTFRAENLLDEIMSLQLGCSGGHIDTNKNF